MANIPASTQKDETRKPIRNLLIWLALFPLIFGSMLCVSQIPFLLTPKAPGANTRSLVQAAYLPWSYDGIPPILIEAFIQDVQKEQRINGTPLAANAATFTPDSARTAAAAGWTETAAVRASATAQVTITPTPIYTPTPIAATSTPPPTESPQPTATRSPMPTQPIFPPQPTSTDVPEQPKPSRTPAPPTSTNTAAPRANTPVNTPGVPTNTPETPTPTTPAGPVPTYAPVRPIAENNGDSIAATGGGCQAFFGYQNDNVQEVVIQPDSADPSKNSLSQTAIINLPELPTLFLVGRASSTFTAIWTVPGDLIWYLDGRTATARWCNP